MSPVWASSTGKSQISSDCSYLFPEVFSGNADTIPHMSFYVMDKDYKPITGIVVDQIEIKQQGALILSATKVKSYSRSGWYYSENINLQTKFSNNNGNNKVDIVFYQDGTEVARLLDFTIPCYDQTVISSVRPTILGTERNEFPLDVTILNASDNATVDAYYTDTFGNKVATLVAENHNVRSHDSAAKELHVRLKMLKGALFDKSKATTYSAHILVNGMEATYRGAHASPLQVYDQPLVTKWYVMENPPYRYRIEGINLMKASPFTLKLKQKGEVIGEVTGINAKFNADTYCVYIDEDITSKIKDPNTELETTLYSNGVAYETITFLDKSDSSDGGGNANDITKTDLLSLAMSDGMLTPAFTPDITSYRATVDDSVDSIIVTPTLVDSKLGTITVNNIPVASGQASGAIELLPGDNLITIVVTAPDQSKKTYTINITKDIILDECFIATASFGSKFDPAVLLLRQFRDAYLLTNSPGKAFVNFYYRHSPPIAQFIAGNEPLKSAVRMLLIPFVIMAHLLLHPLGLVTGSVVLFGAAGFYRKKRLTFSNQKL